MKNKKVEITFYDFAGWEEMKIEYRENYFRNGFQDCYDVIKSILLTQNSQRKVDDELKIDRVDKCYSGIIDTFSFCEEKIRIKRISK